jgi:hypothetical protein
LLVLEITNEDTGEALRKPGHWLDGNLHASEVFGAEVCLKTVEWMVQAGAGGTPKATVKVISEKAGTHTEVVTLKK